VSGLLDLVFPARCAGCDRPGTLLCDSCRLDVALIDPAAACPRCGAPDGRVHCTECGGRDFAFVVARCAALLAPPVSHAVVALKDGGERRYADLLAGLLADTAPDWVCDADALVPVPAAPAAVRRRGIAQGLACRRQRGSAVARARCPLRQPRGRVQSGGRCVGTRPHRAHR